MFYVCWSKAASHSNDTIFCAVPWVCMSSVCKLLNENSMGTIGPLIDFVSSIRQKKPEPHLVFFSHSL